MSSFNLSKRSSFHLNFIIITSCIFIKKVTNNIENFAYNKIIANFHENYASLNKIILQKFEKEKLIKNYKKILIIMSPIIPHIARECLEMIDIKENVLWPEIDESFLIEQKKKYVVQINGKTRHVIEGDKDLTEQDLLAKINENPKLKNFIKNKIIKKKIFIPNKLINIII